MMQLDVLDFLLLHHGQLEQKFRALLVVRVLVIEQHLVVQVVVARVTRDTDQIVEIALLTHVVACHALPRGHLTMLDIIFEIDAASH